MMLAKSAKTKSFLKFDLKKLLVFALFDSSYFFSCCPTKKLSKCLTEGDGGAAQGLVSQVAQCPLGPLAQG